MKVFISWSGDKSRALAEVLNQSLPSVLQAVRPYYSPDDLGKGTRWSTEIAHELEQSRVGLICLTQENLSAPWIMFEAGSLAKELDESRVCPILFDLDTTDLQGPLVQFQAAGFEKSDVKRVVSTINEALGDSALDQPVLDKVFNKWWPELQTDVEAALDEFRTSDSDEIRSQRDLLEEMLELVRFLSQESRKRTATTTTVISARSYIKLARSFHQVVASAPQSAKLNSTLIDFADQLHHLLSTGGGPTEAMVYLQRGLDLFEAAVAQEEEEIPF